MEKRYYKELIKYLFRAKHRRGYGVHSPSMFHLVTMVIEEQLPYYKYLLIERLRKLSKKGNVEYILDKDKNLKEVNRLFLGKSSSKAVSYEQLLFRLVNYYKPRKILEIGTSGGFTTLYLAAPNSKTEVITLSPNSRVSRETDSLISSSLFKNIRILECEIKTDLSSFLRECKDLDFVSVNCQVVGEDLYHYYNKVKRECSFQGILVLNEPYIREQTRQELERIKSEIDVRVVVDMFHIVILIFNPELQKEEYILRY